MTAIKVENLSKTFKLPKQRMDTVKEKAFSCWRKLEYEKFKALDDVSFEIKKGEFFGIIGRNGSGKSTLLKILAGIYNPQIGKIKMSGKLAPFLELGVGFNAELTARENIYLNGVVLGLSRKQIDQKFDEIIAFAELEKFVDQKLKNFSSGMQVRLAFSVAIQAEARILLIDEVLAVGDARFQAKCFDVFRKLKDQGKTIIFVSHDLKSIEEFCDRVLLLDDGQVVKLSSPKEAIIKYLDLNMSRENVSLKKKKEQDKPDTIVANETKSVRKEWGNKKATIESCKFYSGNNSNNILDYGKDIKVVLEVKFHSDIQEPVFGIVLRDQNFQDVFVTNTLWKEIKTGAFKKGEKAKIEFNLANKLAMGRYYISPAIASKDTKEFYHWQNNYYEFIARHDLVTGGICDFEHEIKIYK